MGLIGAIGPLSPGANAFELAADHSLQLVNVVLAEPSQVAAKSACASQCFYAFDCFVDFLPVVMGIERSAELLISPVLCSQTPS